MTRGQLTIMNPLGLHARPAAKLVDCAARYTSEIRLTHQGQTIDAKSIMSVLMLAAPRGAILEVTLDGSDDGLGDTTGNTTGSKVGEKLEGLVITLLTKKEKKKG